MDDVFFMAKVKSAASLAGMGIEFAGDYDGAMARLASGPTLVVVDLISSKTDPLRLIETIKKDGGPPIVAFLPHVQTELRQQAQALGADHVWARSVLAEKLLAILRTL